MHASEHSLARLVIDAAREHPRRCAVVGPDATLSYAALDDQANALAGALARRGVARGDRVCLWLRKSARAVVAMQAALRVGAVYVPIDPDSPGRRARKIILDSGARCLVLDDDRPSPLLEDDPPVVIIGAPASGSPALDEGPPLASPAPVDAEDLAYILYTSGSTGAPKGVCVSHRAALAFVRWAAALLELGPDDRLASHAAFHFDLSVLDLYASFARGARVCLIPAGASYSPTHLVAFIRAHAITSWYSVPSALIMMIEGGDLLALERPPARFIFAGEPFPLAQLRRLRAGFPGARLFNFYGPTETNVCTFFEVEAIDPERRAPVPIGRACAGDRVWARRVEGPTQAQAQAQAQAQPGELGELVVSGPTVMTGYWGRRPLNGAPYPTGDIVRVLADGVYAFVGRRDHMVKVRGMRIEVGEIEAALVEHPAIARAAVIVAGQGLDARLIAFLQADGRERARPSIIALKRHCAERVPRYMIIDKARHVDALPLNANGKIDRRLLVERELQAGTQAAGNDGN